MSSTKTQDRRLSLRLSAQQKELYARAAGVEGMTLTQFVTSHLDRAAKAAIKDHGAIQLNAEESRRLVEALLNPPAPSPEMARVAQDYKNRVRDDLGF
jgi:uncharacterized protein (DUF1778 family)